MATSKRLSNCPPTFYSALVPVFMQIQTSRDVDYFPNYGRARSGLLKRSFLAADTAWDRVDRSIDRSLSLSTTLGLVRPRFSGRSPQVQSGTENPMLLCSRRKCPKKGAVSKRTLCVARIARSARKQRGTLFCPRPPEVWLATTCAWVLDVRERGTGSAA